VIVGYRYPSRAQVRMLGRLLAMEAGYSLAPVGDPTLLALQRRGMVQLDGRRWSLTRLGRQTAAEYGFKGRD